MSNFKLSVKLQAGNLSTLFDVGGVVGGILAGYISDCLDARAITADCFGLILDGFLVWFVLCEKG